MAGMINLVSVGGMVCFIVYYVCGMFDCLGWFCMGPLTLGSLPLVAEWSLFIDQSIDIRLSEDVMQLSGNSILYLQLYKNDLCILELSCPSY